MTIVFEDLILPRATGLLHSHKLKICPYKYLVCSLFGLPELQGSGPLVPSELDPFNETSYCSFFMHSKNIFKSARYTPFSASCSDFPLTHMSFLVLILPGSLIICLHQWVIDIHFSSLHALICSVQLSACTPWVFPAHPHLQAADAVPDSSPSVTRSASMP